ncbi:MAG: hypothetical protein OER87_15460 [Gammaproteobacteria bacterium]|nr:hypothetical protein [Gammaproteobacteria bacterium]
MPAGKISHFGIARRSEDTPVDRNCTGLTGVIRAQRPQQPSWLRNGDHECGVY